MPPRYSVVSSASARGEEKGSRSAQEREQRGEYAFHGVRPFHGLFHNKAPLHNAAACRRRLFRRLAACRFLDLPQVNLRNTRLRLTKNPFAGRPPHLCGADINKNTIINDILSRTQRKCLVLLETIWYKYVDGLHRKETTRCLQCPSRPIWARRIIRRTGRRAKLIEILKSCMPLASPACASASLRGTAWNRSRANTIFPSSAAW